MRAIASLLLVALLCACGAAPPKPPVEVSGQVMAGSSVNPDASGRASPVVVRLYLLGSDNEFMNADFAALYADERAALGAALIERREYLLTPGSSQALSLSLPASAHSIGAIAAFRDVRAARWRAAVAAPDVSPPQGALKVSVEADRIDLQLAQ